jgi:hypothetical protein
VNFYSSKGWKVGSAAMKDWRAAVRTWEGRDGLGPTAQSAIKEPGWDEMDDAERMYWAKLFISTKRAIPKHMKPYADRCQHQETTV